MKKIEFYRHNLTEGDIGRAGAVLRSLFLTTGRQVARFEARLAEYGGIAEAVGVTSCTAAIHLALLRAGIGPGDEVLTTPMTYVATATAIMQAGARPRFVDVCPRSGLMRPEDAASRVTRRTRAVLPVHLYGRMADMRGFARLARKHGLALVEDAAHCLEGSRAGVRPGMVSDAACFSFYATKSMTSGEGGAVTCRSSKDAAWYRSMRHHGVAGTAARRYGETFRHWDMDRMGWKYNMDDIQAALLIGQIGRLEGYRLRRQRLEELYRELLRDVDGLEFIEPPGPDEVSGHHLFTVLVPEGVSRDGVAAELQRRGIGCAVNYRAIHTLRYFRKELQYAPEDFPAAWRMGRRTLSLPLYPKLKKSEVRSVCRVVRGILGGR